MTADPIDTRVHFPLEELRELGFDPSPLPSPKMPKAPAVPRGGIPEVNTEPQPRVIYEDDDKLVIGYPETDGCRLVIGHRVHGYTPPAADYATPWRVADYDERVLVLDAEGTSLFEVFPGQARGYVATREDRRAIAEAIVECVNRALGDGYEVCALRRQIEADRQNARDAAKAADEHEADLHRAAADGNPHHGDDA